MSSSSPIDFSFLEQKYNFVTSPHPTPVCSTSLSDLLDEEKAKKLLQTVMQIIRAGQPDIAAYHMSSWFGMICSAVQASLSLYDSALQISPEQVSIQITIVDGRRKVGFLLHDAHKNCIPIKEAGITRAEALHAFYEQTMQPILRGLAHASATRENQLWAQFVTRLHNEKDYCLTLASSPDRKLIIEQDFAILLKELNWVKLELPKNPFDQKFRWIEHMHNPDEQIRQKAACCLAYKTDTNHGYCYTCPRLDEEGRSAKRDGARQIS
jgi:hypothetical protein